MQDFWRNTWEKRGQLIVSTHKGLVRCESEWRWDRRGFDKWDIWLVMDGSGQISVDRSAHTITGGFSLCIPPGDWEIHAGHDPSQPLLVFFCHFDLKLPPGGTPSRFPEPEPVHLATNPILWATVRELANTFDGDPGTSLQENLLWQLLLRRERADPDIGSSAEDRVRVMMNLIRESPAEARDIEQMAREAAMSTGHFRRVFQKLTGQSPAQFIINHRIKRAAYYLRETSLPIQRVANTVGYKDVYFFSRQFKERTGMSPSAFRRSGPDIALSGH